MSFVAVLNKTSLLFILNLKTQSVLILIKLIINNTNRKLNHSKLPANLLQSDSKVLLCYFTRFCSSLHMRRSTIKSFWLMETLEDSAGVAWDRSIKRQIDPNLFPRDRDGWKTAFHESAWKHELELGAALDRQDDTALLHQRWKFDLLISLLGLPERLCGGVKTRAR